MIHILFQDSEIPQQLDKNKKFNDLNLALICRIVSFITSASGSRQVGPGRSIEEFLVLMEYCPAVLSDILKDRSKPYPPDTVARIFTQVNRIFQNLSMGKYLARNIITINILAH